MGFEPVSFIYLSEIIGSPVVSLRTNARLGRVTDLAAVTGQVYPKVTGAVVSKITGGPPLFVPWSVVRRSDYARKLLVDFDAGAPPERAGENEILLRKSFWTAN